ncbi:MAG: hypothetical protein GY838_05765 [bacterium]|nr:hypothetical protein [bacterium]
MNKDHSMISWNPVVHEEWPDAPSQSIWLKPTGNLPFPALKGLKQVFAIDVNNMLELKRKLCDDSYHLLADDLHPDRASELALQLCELGIEFEVRTNAAG